MKSEVYVLGTKIGDDHEFTFRMSLRAERFNVCISALNISFQKIKVIISFTIQYSFPRLHVRPIHL